MTLSVKSSLILPWNKAAFPREGHFNDSTSIAFILMLIKVDRYNIIKDMVFVIVFITHSLLN